MRLTANGHAMYSELELRRDFFQRGSGTFTARQTVGEDANLMAEIGLPCSKIENVPEDAADRSANRVKDAKRRIRSVGHVKTSVRR